MNAVSFHGPLLPWALVKSLFLQSLCFSATIHSSYLVATLFRRKFDFYT